MYPKTQASHWFHKYSRQHDIQQDLLFSCSCALSIPIQLVAYCVCRSLWKVASRFILTFIYICDYKSQRPKKKPIEKYLWIKQVNTSIQIQCHRYINFLNRSIFKQVLIFYLLLILQGESLVTTILEAEQLNLGRTLNLFPGGFTAHISINFKGKKIMKIAGTCRRFI